jgi:hypothetical protein
LKVKLKTKIKNRIKFLENIRQNINEKEKPAEAMCLKIVLIELAALIRKDKK